jgi:hypothetical protein
MAEIPGLVVRVEDLGFLQTKISDIIEVMLGQTARITYEEGFADGELFGDSSEVETLMEPIVLGETDNDKKRIAFHIYNVFGQPASGLFQQGAVCVPVIGQVQTNRDLAGYVNSGGVFTHMGDGVYTYTFSGPEVDAVGGEGNVWLRVKVPGFRTVVLRVPLRIQVPTAIEIRDAILASARAGYLVSGSIGEGVSVAVALLQGNFYMDTVVNGGNGQTSARLRCFSSGAGAQAATPGGSGQGEFATFIVTTTYAGPNKVVTHRVVQQ